MCVDDSGVEIAKDINMCVVFFGDGGIESAESPTVCNVIVNIMCS